MINEEKIPAPLFKDDFYGKLLEDLSLKKYEDKVLMKEAERILFPHDVPAGDPGPGLHHPGPGLGREDHNAPG